MNDRDVRNIIKGGLASFMSESPILRVDEGDRPADQIQGWADGESTDDGQWTLSRLEQYGDIVVPPGKGNSICFRVGENGVAIPRNSPRWRPTGVSKRGNRGIHADKGNLVLLHGSGSATPGVVEIKTSAGTQVRLHGSAGLTPGAIEIAGPNGAKLAIDKEGGIQIQAAPGKDVVVNGGTAQAVRAGAPAGYLCVTTTVGVITAVVWSPTPIVVVPPAVVVCTPISLSGGGSPNLKV